MYVIAHSSMEGHRMSDIIHAHSTWLPTYGGRQVTASELSQRELDVLRLLTQGLSHEEIGRTLRLTDHTVKSFIRATYRKIGVTRRSQAVSWGFRNGLLDLTSDGAA